MGFFTKQFAANITYEEEWAFVKGEESNLKWQKSIWKEAKHRDSPHILQPCV